MADAAGARRAPGAAGRRGSANRSSGSRTRNRTSARKAAPPLEHRILLTATLCLLAFGAVMVYSASSPRDLLGAAGNGTSEFIRYLTFGAIGLAAMHVLSRRGVLLLHRRLVGLLLLGSFALLLLVL